MPWVKGQSGNPRRIDTSPAGKARLRSWADSAQGPAVPLRDTLSARQTDRTAYGLLVSGVGIRRGSKSHVRHETSRFHHAARQRGSGLAARSARAAAVSAKTAAVVDAL
jgi:hypothetical protein